MSSTTHLPTRPAIEHPDCDGEPMADNTLQYKWMVVIKEGLEAVFHENPHVFVAGNLLWYPVEEEPTIRVAPDAMVAFDRPKGRRGSYRQWEEGNIAPHVVFEILSPGNRPEELENKFEFYEKYGVQEYYIYDPDDGTLEGWLRDGDHLDEIPKMAGFVSPRLGIRFEPGEGSDNLEIVGPDGEPFVTHPKAIEQRNSERQQKEAERQRANDALQRAEAERQQKEAERQRANDALQRAEAERQQKEAERQRANDALQRAEAERQRADDALQRAAAERQRADDADLRAERLAARLRELGIEPD